MNCRASEDSQAFNEADLKSAYIGRMAVRALLYEVSATPKPGLVDRANNGAHKDMCFETFLDSAAALKDCFFQCAAVGTMAVESPGFYHAEGDSTNFDTEALRQIDIERLRQIGLEGEKSMFAATGGVNTHKGLIFSLGIISAALGMLSAAEKGRILDEASSVASQEAIDKTWGELTIVDSDVLNRMCAKIASDLLGASPESGASMNPNPRVFGRKAPLSVHGKTHGMTVLETTGISGVRGEALSGFRSAFEIGLPAIKKWRENGGSMNGAMVYALLSLMEKTDDSNILYRGGAESLCFVKRRAGEILREVGNDEKKLFAESRVLDAECIERNLSPGGSADLLAISVMLFFVLEERLQGR